MTSAGVKKNGLRSRKAPRTLRPADVLDSGEKRTPPVTAAQRALSAPTMTPTSVSTLVLIDTEEESSLTGADSIPPKATIKRSGCQDLGFWSMNSTAFKPLGNSLLCFRITSSTTPGRSMKLRYC